MLPIYVALVLDCAIIFSRQMRELRDLRRRNRPQRPRQPPHPPHPTERPQQTTQPQPEQTTQPSNNRRHYRAPRRPRRPRLSPLFRRGVPFPDEGDGSSTVAEPSETASSDGSATDDMHELDDILAHLENLQSVES